MDNHIIFTSPDIREDFRTFFSENREITIELLRIRRTRGVNLSVFTLKRVSRKLNQPYPLVKLVQSVLKNCLDKNYTLERIYEKRTFTDRVLKWNLKKSMLTLFRYPDSWRKEKC